MGTYLVEPTKPGVPFFAIWRCDYKGCDTPESEIYWEGRWDAIKRAAKDLNKHRVKAHKGYIWAGSRVKVTTVAKAVNHKGLKKEVSRGRRKSKANL